MRRPLRRPPPLAFSLTIAALWVLLCHALDLHALEQPPVLLGFFGFLIALGNIIWGALQAVGQATLAALSWTVNALWLGLREVRNGLSAFGRDLLGGFRSSWDFLRRLYDDVLKPAWQKFWRLVDRVHDVLDRLFRPVFAFLRHLRDELLQLYTKWVRPVLDTIQVARQMLRVLSALHLDFARKLDAKLGALEDAIDRPFRFLLGKLNEVINLVNRIVTLDGLIQRLALVRSIERDIRYVYAELHNNRSTPLSAGERQQLAEGNQPRTPKEIETDLDQALQTSDFVLWTPDELTSFGETVFGSSSP